MAVDSKVVAAIGHGVVVLLGIATGDTPDDGERLAGKIARLRIFPDDEGRFDRSLIDVGGEALVVSQFTLLADTTKGNRPSFTDAADPTEAEPLYERFSDALGREARVSRGVFGASMAVALVNDGPVTFIMEM